MDLDGRYLDEKGLTIVTTKDNIDCALVPVLFVVILYAMTFSP